MDYKKSDFLTPFAYAKLNNLDPDLVTRAMCKMWQNHMTIRVHYSPRPTVVKRASTYYLRPEADAHQQITQVLKQLKEKQK